MRDPHVPAGLRPFLRSAVLVPLAALAAWPGAVSAEAPKPAAPAAGTKATAPLQAEGAQAEVTVRVGEVQLLVTDKNGNPVRDLKAEEIEVREDGEKRRIAYVEPFATRDLAVRLLPNPTPLVTARGEKLPVEEGVHFPVPKARRWIGLVFDEFNSRTQDRERWVTAARGWVEKGMQPDDRVSLSVLDKKGIRQVVGFTGSRDVMLQALSSPGFMAAGEYHDWHADMTELVSNFLACENAYNKINCIITASQPVVASWEARTRATVRSLREYVATLAAVPGRKIVLFVSNGLILDPGALAGEAIRAKLGPEQLSFTSGQMLFQTKLQGTMLDMTRVAAAAGVTFFTFDTRASSRRNMSNDVDQREMSYMNTTGDPFASMFDMTRSSLGSVALQTGGRALDGPIIEKNLPIAAAAAEGLYTVGFYRDSALAGQPKIKVKLARKGLEVSFPDRFTGPQVLPQVVRLELGIGRARPVEQNVELPVLIQIPLDDLAFTRGEEGGLQARVALFAEAIAPDGRRAAESFELVQVDVSEPQYEKRLGRKFAHQLTLAVPPGPYRVRARMSDAEFLHAAERAIDLTVGTDFVVRPGIQDSVRIQNPVHDEAGPAPVQPAGSTGK